MINYELFIVALRMETASFYVMQWNKRYSEQPDPCGNALFKKTKSLKKLKTYNL